MHINSQNILLDHLIEYIVAFSKEISSLMEGQEPPLPPRSLQPPLPPLGDNLPLLIGSSEASLLPQEMLQNPQIGSDIDWVSLLSGSIINDSGACQMSIPASAPLIRSMNANSYIGGENANKSKGKTSKTKKYVPPRIAFHTRSAEDILDDGYKWRKYGQKAVKNSSHPRSYYRCTQHTCNVKKQIQRHSKDKSIVVTTYEGIHNHPCEKLMETLSPLLRQLQFLSRF